MTVALVACLDNLALWRTELLRALPGEELVVWPEWGDPASIDVAVVAKPPPGVLAALPNLRLIASLWAGVDGLLADPTLPPSVPITRLVDPGLTRAMVESVALHLLFAHRLGPRYRVQQQRGQWIQHEQPAADERTVAILGFGELGRACASALQSLGFRVVAWTRSPRDGKWFELHHGPDGLLHVLGRADILVCLLPATAATRGLLDDRAFAALKRGATIINVGRGATIEDEALLTALDRGHVEAAILDVFAKEPLPPEHRYWRHERVCLYPHVAAETDPQSAAPVVADTIRRFRAGEALPERVDRARGY